MKSHIETSLKLLNVFTSVVMSFLIIISLNERCAQSVVRQSDVEGDGHSKCDRDEHRKQRAHQIFEEKARDEKPEELFQARGTPVHIDEPSPSGSSPDGFPEVEGRPDAREAEEHRGQREHVHQGYQPPVVLAENDVDPERERGDHELRAGRQEPRRRLLVEAALASWDLPRAAVDEEACGDDGAEERHGVRRHERPERQPPGQHGRARTRVVVRDVAPRHGERGRERDGGDQHGRDRCGRRDAVDVLGVLVHSRRCGRTHPAVQTDMILSCDRCSCPVQTVLHYGSRILYTKHHKTIR